MIYLAVGYLTRLALRKKVTAFGAGVTDILQSYSAIIR